MKYVHIKSLLIAVILGILVSLFAFFSYESDREIHEIVYLVLYFTNGTGGLSYIATFLLVCILSYPFLSQMINESNISFVLIATRQKSLSVWYAYIVKKFVEYSIISASTYHVTVGLILQALKIEFYSNEYYLFFLSSILMMSMLIIFFSISLYTIRIYTNLTCAIIITFLIALMWIILSFLDRVLLSKLNPMDMYYLRLEDFKSTIVINKMTGFFSFLMFFILCGFSIVKIKMPFNKEER